MRKTAAVTTCRSRHEKQSDDSGNVGGLYTCGPGSVNPVTPRWQVLIAISGVDPESDSWGVDATGDRVACVADDASPRGG